MTGIPIIHVNHNNVYVHSTLRILKISLNMYVADEKDSRHTWT